MLEVIVAMAKSSTALTIILSEKSSRSKKNVTRATRRTMNVWTKELWMCDSVRCLSITRTKALK